MGEDVHQVNTKGDGSVDHDSGLGTSKHKSIGSNVRPIEMLIYSILIILFNL